MPVEYDSHGRPARIRKKEKDSRSVTSSGSSRRHRDSSTSSNRTPAPSDCSTDNAQQPINLDQLPDLPESGPDSPSSMTSPIIRTSSNISTSTSLTTPIQPHHTPATLQPYLESDPDLPSSASSAQETPKAEKPRESLGIHTHQKTPPQSSQTPAQNPKPSLNVAPSAPPKPISPRPPPSTIVNRQRSSPEPHDSGHRGAPSVGYGHNEPVSVATHPVDPGLPASGPFHSPYAQYVHLPQGSDPVFNQQQIVPHRLPYHLGYGAPAPDYSPHRPVYHSQAQIAAPGRSDQLQILPAETSRPTTSLTRGSWDTATGSGGEKTDDRAMTLFYRLQSTLPDIQTLIDLYQEKRGLLEAREHQIHEMEGQKTAALQQRDRYITNLETEIQDMAKKHSAEDHQLRYEVKRLTQENNELRQKLSTLTKLKDDIKAAKETLSAELQDAKRRHDADKIAMTHAFSLERDQMAAEHRTNQRALNDQVQAQRRTADATLSSQLAEASKNSEKEKQNLENGWMQQRRQLEDRHAKTQRDLESALESKCKVIDEERHNYLQTREDWDRERGALFRGWEQERALLQKSFEEQRNALTIKYQREKDDILRKSAQQRNNNEMEDHTLMLQREIEALRAGWEADKFKFQSATADFKSTARTLNEQNNKLQKLTEAFGGSPGNKGE